MLVVVVVSHVAITFICVPKHAILALKDDLFGLSIIKSITHGSSVVVVLVVLVVVVGTLITSLTK